MAPHQPTVCLSFEINTTVHLYEWKDFLKNHFFKSSPFTECSINFLSESGFSEINKPYPTHAKYQEKKI